MDSPALPQAAVYRRKYQTQFHGAYILTRKPNTANADLRHVEQAVIAAKETVEQVVKVSTETQGKAFNMTKDQVEKSSTSLIKGYDEITEISQKNVEAFVMAGNLWAKGVESIGKAYFNLIQDSTSASVEFAQAMFAAKTPKDAFDVQSKYAKASMETFVSESKKINDMTLKAANEAFKPIQVRVNGTIEKVLTQTVA